MKSHLKNFFKERGGEMEIIVVDSDCDITVKYLNDVDDDDY